MPPQKRKEPPSMLQNVVSAISALKDAQGSTVQSIVRQINRGASRGRIKKNGTTIQIRKALQQGSRAGVLVHRAGKYKLASSPVIHSKDIVEAGPAARQKKPPRKRSKIKKSRSRSLSNPSDFPPEEGENDSDDDGEVTERSRSRRRRRRRSRRRRRRREYNEAGLERGSEYEHDVLPRKRLRLSRSRSALGNTPICV